MESGVCTIRAFFINEYGVKSDVVSERFSIDVSVPDPPEVTPASGTYETPTPFSISMLKVSIWSTAAINSSNAEASMAKSEGRSFR